MEASYRILSKTIERLLIIIFALLVLDVVGQVFSRYLLGKSFSFTEEFARFALIWLSLLGAAYLNGKQAHLSMDYLLKKLSKKDPNRRVKIIECMMFLFALLVLVIGGGNLVYLTFVLGQKSPAMNISLGYVYSIIPISGLIIMYYSIYHINRQTD